MEMRRAGKKMTRNQTAGPGGQHIGQYPAGRPPMQAMHLESIQPEMPPMPAMHMESGQPNHWTTGLFDCLGDLSSCAVTFFCPQLTFGKIADIVDHGSTSCPLSATLYFLVNSTVKGGYLYSCFYRTKLRQQYNLEEGTCPDLIVHAFCEPCALCQEYRELKNRGFNMDMGWEGNLELQTPGVRRAPALARGRMS